jgi:hypothetical protein
VQQEGKIHFRHRRKIHFECLYKVSHDHCKHVFIPMIKFIVEFTKTINPFAPINQFEMKCVPYANVIGSLMYLVINILSDFVHRLVVLIMANPCGPLH